MTTSVSILFTWSFDCPAPGQLCSSIRDICLARTLSNAGTWENKIGLSDRASVAGSEREVCGWAAKEMMSFEDRPKSTRVFLRGKAWKSSKSTCVRNSFAFAPFSSSICVHASKKGIMF